MTTAKDCRLHLADLVFSFHLGKPRCAKVGLGSWSMHADLDRIRGADRPYRPRIGMIPSVCARRPASLGNIAEVTTHSPANEHNLAADSFPRTSRSWSPGNQMAYPMSLEATRRNWARYTLGKRSIVPSQNTNFDPFLVIQHRYRRCPEYQEIGPSRLGLRRGV
jgi:hypothetical protein